MNYFPKKLHNKILIMRGVHMLIKDLLEDPIWSTALYINEKRKYYTSDDCYDSSQNNNFNKWIEMFNSNMKLFNYRLNFYEVDLNQFKQIIKCKICDCDLFEFKWYKELYNTFTEDYDISSDNFLELDEIPFYEFFIPFIERSIHIIKRELNGFSKQTDINKIIKIHIKNLLSCLSNIATKTLIAELAHYRVNEKLEGDTSSERYNYFIAQNLKNKFYILKFLLKYPLMTRLILEIMIDLNNNFISVIERLLRDKVEIENNFEIKIDQISSINMMGDFHNSHQCVLKFTFADNEALMYKPRDLTIDESFQGLLAYLNKKDMYRKFKILKIINKKDYGWQKYIQHDSCKNNKEVEAFFERQGQYLAVMYLLNATDMHFENIIANGEFPMFVDLESLFKNQAFFLNDDASIFNKDSVLNTSMLPIANNTMAYDNDISGLAGNIEQRVNTYKIINKNTDMMSIGKMCVTVKKDRHIPYVNNEAVIPKLYIDYIIKGFKNCYYIIYNNKTEFINIIKELFIGNTARVILRPTIIYKTLLEVGTNPEYLNTGIMRDYLINYIWRILIKEPKRGHTIKYENDDLLNCNIPFFYYKIGSHSLFNNNNEIKQFFRYDILDQISDKINSMSNENMNIQCNIINDSLREKYFKET